MAPKPLKDTVVVFFTSPEGHRYAAYLLTGTYVFVNGDNHEADMKASLDASGVPWGDEPNVLDRGRYGVEAVDPRKLVTEYLLPAQAGQEMPK